MFRVPGYRLAYQNPEPTGYVPTTDLYPMIHHALCFVFCFPLLLTAQFAAPPASPPAESTVTVGYTEVSVRYHRPGVRGRKIFGKLLPWNTVWRAGANENTLLTFGSAVTIDGAEVPAGTYSLYVLPAENAPWTWIVNRDTTHWGTRGYNQNEDVVRVRARPQRLPEREETLGYRWRDVTANGALLTLEWEWQRVSLPVGVPTDAEVQRRIDAAFATPAEDPDEYYAAARYLLDNGGDLGQAKRWIDRWAEEGDKQFGRMRYQALIEHRLGNQTAATRLMQRSLALAREAGNEHYARMNEQSLRDWTRTVVDLPTDSLLARSIRYHDPTGNWGGRPHLLPLAESRPDGTVRHSRITLYPDSDDFDLQQTRGRDKIQLRYLNGTYSFSHQGRTDIRDEDRDRLNLTPERTRLLRDYYTYLFGLPMKLRDPGTRLQPTVHKVWFQEQEVLELQAYYAPDTGKDGWFFYFNPATYALVGYAFYHDKDSPGTGEYIVLEDEATVDKMRLPAERHWYRTENNLYLGTDSILR